MTLPIDSELGILLDEIARDPESKLFVTTPRQLTLGLRGVIDWIREADFELLPAEQQLLAAHREELAGFLTDAAVAALERDPRSAHSVRSTYDRVPGRGELENRWMRLSGGGSGPEDPEVVRPGTIDFDSAHRLALLALRVRPSPRARLALGLASCLELGHMSSAKLVLRPVAEDGTDDASASAALCNIALCDDLQGDKARALRFYRAAAERQPRVSCLVSALILALYLGEEAPALEAASAIADLPASGQRELEQAFEKALRRKSEGLLAVGRMKRSLLQIEGRIGDVGRALLPLCT